LLHQLQGDVEPAEVSRKLANFYSAKVVERHDKKFFKKQVVLQKNGLFDKKCPTWASDWKLLAEVVSLQNQRAKAWQSQLGTPQGSWTTAGS
jgi:hypothetical protein